MGSAHGEAGCNVLAAFLLAALLAVPLLATLRARMKRYMRRRQTAPYVPPPAPVRPNAVPLRIEHAEHRREPRSAEGRVLAARARAIRRAVMAVYLIAGLACAALLAYGDLRIAGPEARGAKFAVLLAIHIWPLVLAIVTVSASSRGAKVTVLVTAAGVLILFTTAMAHSPVPWIVYVAVPTALLLATMNRYFKTIAPIVVIAACIAGIAANRALDFMRGLADTTPWQTAVALGLIVFAVAFGVGWIFVVLLAAAYRRKLFSELSFQLAFLWTTFCVFFALMRFSEATWWYGFAALGLYTVLTTAAMPFIRAAVEREYAASLLVLRVFGAPARAQTLFDGLGARWRNIGPLHLIAGTDSAAANLDVDEALRYLTFRFRTLFVSDAADLNRRMERLDVRPDPDGRYRTNDFFCFDDTWKSTYTRLLERSYAVMVDLGGFNQHNAGVAFELGQLLARRPLARISHHVE